MQSKSDTQKLAKRFLNKIDSLFDVQKAYLFGSRARGDFHSESDADIAVILAGEPQDFYESKFAMDDVAYDLLLDSGIRIQAIPIWEQQWSNPDEFSNPYLISNIQKEGVLL